jgi:CBS domain-containing protein
MKIREVMTQDPISCPPTATLRDVACIMRDHDTGAVPIVEGGKLLGMVTDRDIVVRAVAEDGSASRTARDVCSADPVCATPEMSTREAEDLMSEHQVRRLPVVEGGRLIGIVSLGDLAVKEGRDRRTGDTLQDISQGVKH